LLDEPTTYLDLAHQIEVLDLLHALNRETKRTIIMVLHELNMASRYSHHLIAIQNGVVMAQGQPHRVITEALVREVFNLDSRIIPDPVFNTPLCIPISQSLY
jgi:iron complex transport system ATP-binding protein